MTIDSLLKSAKSAYKGKRANLVCETLLAHFLGQNRVFLHANGDKKIQDILDSTFATSSLQNSTNFTDISSLRGVANAKAIQTNKKIDCHDSMPRIESRNDKDSLPQDESALQSKLLESISRLNDGYPLEYITKKASFYGMDFFIDKGALIPRPETELLVDKATQLIARHKIQKIYEIGVGSGIIAITLCLLNPRIQITATDISPTALTIAQKNIALKSALDSTLKSRIRLIHADLLQGTDFTPKDSLIISNPPYIAEDYALPKNVAFEPKIALFGGKKGDEILQKIIALNADFLCCEIGHNQGYLADFLGAYKSVEFYRDYAGFTRGFVANR